MTSNLLQDVLRHSAHERLDALVHDREDSDDELVNVVRSILYFGLEVSPKFPSFRCQERPHAPVHPRVRHRPLGELPDALVVISYLLHLPNSLSTPSRYFLPRYPNEYLVCLASLTSLNAHVSRGNGARVRP